MHGSYISAAYILTKLKASQGLVQGMSYWTYSDLFEERGPPPTPFHGGFGLLSREGIRKPAYFAYKYLHALQGERGRDSGSRLASFRCGAGWGVSAIAWHFEQPQQELGNRSFYGRIVPNTPAPLIEMTVRHMEPAAINCKYGVPAFALTTRIRPTSIWARLKN